MINFLTEEYKDFITPPFDFLNLRFNTENKHDSATVSLHLAKKFASFEVKFIFDNGAVLKYEISNKKGDLTDKECERVLQFFIKNRLISEYNKHLSLLELKRKGEILRKNEDAMKYASLDLLEALDTLIIAGTYDYIHDKYLKILIRTFELNGLD